ncbi:MAG TPA: TetR/AcrR family transcriptional regulator [Terriglobales bacterium]|nr:TetR/AcrR family transcriptional regulator [Terriglobales bacterium]
MPSRKANAAAEAAAPALSSHDRILQAAKQLFASRGYENTSTVNIARQAGTSESQLMKHFGSKEGLLEAIFEQGWEQMAYQSRSVEEPASPKEKLRALLDLMVNTLQRDPELKQLFLLEGRRVRKEGRMVLMTEGYLRFVKVLDGILGQMKQAGSLREDLDAQALRSGLTGMFEGMLRDQLLAERMGYPATYGIKELRAVFNCMIEAVAKR